MPHAENRTLLLAHAKPSDFAEEFVRRVRTWLAALPDGSRWTGMDYAFAATVAVLALSSTGFFTTAYRIWSNDPDYFSRRLIASMEEASLDPINTGTVAGSPAIISESADAIPVPAIVRAKPLAPSDYEIVMIFGEEALLATARELWRVKVGSTLPGLGQVLAIDPAGKSILSQNATLTMAAE